MFLLCGIRGGKAFFVSSSDCPSGVESAIGIKTLDEATLSVLENCEINRAIILAQNLGVHTIGRGEIIFQGSPRGTLRRLKNGLIVDGVYNLALKPFIFDKSLEYVKTLMNGIVVYRYEGPKVSFLNGKFYCLYDNKDFISHTNSLLNDSITRTLTSSIITSDAPAVAKKLLQNVPEEYIFSLWRLS